MGPIKRTAITFALAALAAPALAANMATCLLDRLPGVANDVAAQAVFQVCASEHPGGIQAVPQGDGRGLLGFKSGADCTAKKASDTRSTRAAELIGVACRRLYDAPVKLRPFNGKLDEEPKLRPFNGVLDGELAPTRQ